MIKTNAARDGSPAITEIAFREKIEMLEGCLFFHAVHIFQISEHALDADPRGTTVLTGAEEGVPVIDVEGDRAMSLEHVLLRAAVET